MLTRRELVTSVTGGAVGALAAGATTKDVRADGAQAQDTAAIVQGLSSIRQGVANLGTSVDGAASTFRVNTVAYGFVPQLREKYTQYLRANAKFPAFCEVGIGVFYDIYDWHVKNSQPLQVSRNADGRMAITFMYTQLLVRVDQDSDYIGVPFDRA